MNPDIKAQWVAALREPGRVQGKGLLRNQSGAQCCLDVLCELGVNAGAIAAPVLNSDFTEEPVFVYEDTLVKEIINKEGDTVQSNFQWEVLPSEIVTWAGLGFQSPDVPYPDDDDPEGEVSRCELTLLNDEYELSFPQIAQLIENSDL